MGKDYNGSCNIQIMNGTLFLLSNGQSKPNPQSINGGENNPFNVTQIFIGKVHIIRNQLSSII